MRTESSATTAARWQVSARMLVGNPTRKCVCYYNSSHRGCLRPVKDDEWQWYRRQRRQREVTREISISHMLTQQAATGIPAQSIGTHKCVNWHRHNKRLTVYYKYCWIHISRRMPWISNLNVVWCTRDERDRFSFICGREGGAHIAHSPHNEWQPKKRWGRKISRLSRLESVRFRVESQSRVNGDNGGGMFVVPNIIAAANRRHR